MEYDIETSEANFKHFPEENLVRVYNLDGTLRNEIAVDPNFGKPIVSAVNPHEATKATLTAPIETPVITGSTVAAVRSSANTAVDTMKQEMQDRLSAVADLLG